MISRELESKAKLYSGKRGLSTVTLLGFGTDGYVWKTSRKTAVKVFERSKQYECERDSYRRLAQYLTTEIDGFAIPKLVDFDDDLWVVEMAIVSPPYILDFGKVYLDCAPDHTPEVMTDWEESMRELWEDRWPTIQSILWQLEKIGIYYQDPKPGNITFGEPE